MVIWYGITSLVFGLILSIPLRRFIMNISINKFQRKNDRAITDEERSRLDKKIKYISLIIAITFAFIYNKFMIIKFF